jgi:hypothetical protein
MEVYTSAVLGGLVSSLPALLGWTVALVLAVIMLRRGGARAERLLVAGASLMLLQSVVAALTSAVVSWLTLERGMANVEIAFINGAFGLAKGLIGLAGIICLVYAFWLKFKAGK